MARIGLSLSNNRALRYGLAVPCFIVAVIATVLWASEVWQRPLVMMEWDEGMILTIAVAAFCVGGSAMILTRSRITARRVSAVIGACGLAFLGIAIMTHLAAVQTLMKHRDVRQAIDKPIPVAVSASWMDTIGEWLDGPLMDSLDWLLGHLDGFGKQDDHLENQPLDQLLESSRWRVRKAFIHAVMRDEDAIVVATKNWHRIFPAVVGQDVTLARRQELLRDFTGIAQEASTTSRRRGVVVFWMGLIVATDMEALEQDRPRVRDLMLAVDTPPMNRTGDVWMRVLNSLLSMDEPDEHAALAKQLIRDQARLRRAVRECVRGIEEWTEAIILEIENLDDSGDSTSAAALWLDLHHLIGDRNEHSETRLWLGETMARWLLEDSEHVSARFNHGYVIRGDDFAIDLPVDIQAILLTHIAWLAHAAPAPLRASDPRSQTMPLKLGHAMMIHNFLNGHHRRSASATITEILVKHLHSISKDLDAAKGQQRMIHEYAAAVWMCENDLEAAKREKIMKSLMRLETILARHPSMLSTVSALLEKVSPTTEFLDSGDFASLVMRRGGVKWWSNHWWGEVSGSFEPKFADEAVEKFIDSILTAKYRRDNLVRAETDEIYAGVRANQLMHVLKFRRYDIAREPEQSARDYLNVSLVRARALPASHLPENLAEVFHADPRLHNDHWNLPDPEYWGRLLASPAEAQAVLDKFDVRNDYILRGMMEYLLNHPPEAKIQEVIIRHYETRLTSNQRWQRITAARVLLRLSHWREPREKADLRERLASFFKDTKPSLFEWAHTMMIPMEPQHDYPRGYAILEDHCRSEWIEWADDDLSARFSWSSQIHFELAPLPHNWKLKPDDGLFMYLNSYLDACDACPWTGVRYEPKKSNEAVAAGYRRGPVPAPPFTATPWQRARELHLRRPDLEFPERALYRPHFHNRE